LRFIGVLFLHYQKKQGGQAAIRIGYNGYPTGSQKNWLATFMQEYTGQQIAASWYKPTVIFASCFGSYWLLRIILLVFRVPSLFFSEENLTTLKKYREYAGYLDGRPTLAMGFDYRSEENYRRFPLWLLYIFPPDFAAKATVEQIQQQLDRIEQQSHLPKEKFAAMIASHDGYASKKKVYGCTQKITRTAITRHVSTIDFVHCPGKLLHNDDSLQNEYADDKNIYLKQFLFNICAENASVPGYVTEKLFDALAAGTIPVYWGDTDPEPTILNRQRIIFWDDTRANDLLATIKELYLEQDTREKFLQQALFTDCAAIEIYNYFEQLRSDLDSLLARRQI